MILCSSIFISSNLFMVSVTQMGSKQLINAVEEQDFSQLQSTIAAGADVNAVANNNE